jgi:hypothetical protein
MKELLRSSRIAQRSKNLLAKNVYLWGLPPNKMKSWKGFCEPPPGDPDHSRVVNLNECRNCPVDHCHMFKAITNKHGTIVGREFILHQPEY